MIIKCPKLNEFKNITHGFFTRKGGVSDGIYKSLNTGFGSNDMLENVIENRSRAIKMMGLQDINFTKCHQAHTNIVHIVDKPWSYKDSPQGDGLVTKIPGIVIAVDTADCGPVLFFDPKAKVIGAAHAGWRGAYTGILENTIEAMVRIGADKHNIYATLGPCIRQKSYEVDSGFYENFLNQDKKNSSYFIPSKRPTHFMFDLSGYIIERLKNAGLKNVSCLNHDTCSEHELFFSYRYNCLNGIKDYGRQLSAIALL